MQPDDVSLQRDLQMEKAFCASLCLAICITCVMFIFFKFPADTNTSEMLVTMGSVQLEEFYPAVAVSALMRIVRDPSLSSHHTMVIQVQWCKLLLSQILYI